MINFRYHIVSLVAVFLALGLGVLFGASFIDQNVVKALQGSQTRLADRNEDLRGRVLELQRLNEGQSEFASRTRDALVRGAIADRPVVLLSFESTPSDLFTGVANTLRLAGGRIEQSIEILGNLDLGNETRRQQVALALDTTGTDASVLSGLLEDELTKTLTGKSEGFFRRLEQSGLVRSKQVPDVALKEIGGVITPGSVVVVIEGGQELEPLHQRITIPVLESAAEQGTVSVAVEEGIEDLQVVGAIRERGLKVVTVDGAKSPAGEVALALGLRAALRGEFGHYGNGEGADAPVPETAGQ